MKPIANPPNPYLKHTLEWADDAPPPRAKLEIYEEDSTRTIITRNTSPDVGFDYSVNPYRGCTHACSYCFARPYHEYLVFGGHCLSNGRLSPIIFRFYDNLRF